ncbi:hypothetical protein ABZ871_39315 [Streptomyces populi]
MAVEPRPDVRRLRVRLRGYLLAVPVSAGWAFLGHRWMSEPWSAAMELMLFMLATCVLYGEIRARRLRHRVIRRMPDRAKDVGQ